MNWIIPYNKYLLKKYNCHINIEIANSVKSVKYIFKYIFKGKDRSMKVKICWNIYNEIKNYYDCRYVGHMNLFGR
jgi:hypothetical protein